MNNQTNQITESPRPAHNTRDRSRPGLAGAGFLTTEKQQ